MNRDYFYAFWGSKADSALQHFQSEWAVLVWTIRNIDNPAACCEPLDRSLDAVAF